jgi:3-methylfumaryl-CoA hydratase
MWAGGRLLFQGELRIGETLTRRSTIREVTAKEGRSGLLCFVKVEHVLQAGDRRVLIEDQDIVYRAADDREEPPPGSSPLPPPPAPAGQHRRVVTPSPALLFRYSALTFNGHRIHYDLPYARNVEGYPGLVVHGPLQATLLAHFAEAILGRPPSEFSFRSLSPLFDDADVTLNATENEAGIRLWTSRPNGPVAMEAQARW